MSKKIINFFVYILTIVLLFSGINLNSANAVLLWRYEGVAFYASIGTLNDSKVYRFANYNTGAYLYTTKENEKNYITNSLSHLWRYEGVAFYSPGEENADRIPVYRFANYNTGAYLYTAKENEKNYITNSLSHLWRYEGVGFYAYATKKTSSKPSYRFANLHNGAYLYTISEKEKDYIINNLCSANLGPEIRVGILGYDKSYSKDHSMRITANKDYVIKDKDGNKIAIVDKDEETKVKYDGDGELRVYKSISDTNFDEDVNFEAADGNNTDMIFHIEPKGYDDYRGKMRIHYTSDYKQVWAINIIPLEQYVWGMGEITGTGPMEYNKVMTVNFRTYGYKKKIHGIINQEKGFDIDVTAGNQIYYGYDWEEDHPRIKEGAEKTWGEMVTYKGDIVWTPYSSSTDGRTRSWEEVWGGTNHKYCQSVPDPWGKVSGAASIPGNHMVGVSATGALNQAKEDDEDYDDILEYYYTGIKIEKQY
ncbi:MAG: hypothetical protein GF347_02490 [Candidatus Moranbacteria bacterium]|nr:hypothetical protein [Candidatus Moranbacteria bacterium]